MKSILRLFVCMCFSIACLFSTLIVEAAQMPLDLVIRASQKLLVIGMMLVAIRY